VEFRRVHFWGKALAPCGSQDNILILERFRDGNFQVANLFLKEIDFEHLGPFQASNDVACIFSWDHDAQRGTWGTLKVYL